MMCPDMEATLNEYVDGTLAAADRAPVEAHLAQCAGCRAAVAELWSLVAGAAALPKSVAPARDLWTGIAQRLRKSEAGRGRRWWRERAFWGGALATAATLVIALGIYRLFGPLIPPARPVERAWVAVEADYQQAAAELGRTLAAQRHRLRPETIAVVERNLLLIDAAIGESRAALGRDPGNAELWQLFAAAHRQKVELLRWAARVATAS